MRGGRSDPDNAGTGSEQSQGWVAPGAAGGRELAGKKVHVLGLPVKNQPPWPKQTVPDEEQGLHRASCYTGYIAAATRSSTGWENLTNNQQFQWVRVRVRVLASPEWVCGRTCSPERLFGQSSALHGGMFVLLLPVHTWLGSGMLLTPSGSVHLADGD